MVDRIDLLEDQVFDSSITCIGLQSEILRDSVFHLALV
jgi:hypothetical protein